MVLVSEEETPEARRMAIAAVLVLILLNILFLVNLNNINKIKIESVL